jgi:hypothetical protein
MKTVTQHKISLYFSYCGDKTFNARDTATINLCKCTHGNWIIKNRPSPFEWFPENLFKVKEKSKHKHYDITLGFAVNIKVIRFSSLFACNLWLDQSLQSKFILL